MDIFMREAFARVGEDTVLSRIEALLDWSAFLPILKRGVNRSGKGPSGYDVLVLFKCMLLGQLA